MWETQYKIVILLNNSILFLLDITQFINVYIKLPNTSGTTVTTILLIDNQILMNFPLYKTHIKLMHRCEERKYRNIPPYFHSTQYI